MEANRLLRRHGGEGRRWGGECVLAGNGGGREMIERRMLKDGGEGRKVMGRDGCWEVVGKG